MRLYYCLALSFAMQTFLARHKKRRYTSPLGVWEKGDQIMVVRPLELFHNVRQLQEGKTIWRRIYLKIKCVSSEKNRCKSHQERAY